jgi:hypothetical protein
VNERGILFSKPMVLALLDGSKTQTRRIVKHEIRGPNYLGHFYWHDKNGWQGAHGGDTPFEKTSAALLCPYGQPGDRLWVRETWGNVAYSFDEAGDRQDWIPGRPATAIHQMPFGKGYYSGHVIYRADGEFEWCDDDGDGERSCWHPNIHMPREASRIDLEITGIRVERLQDISEEDAKAEGITSDNVIIGANCNGGRHTEERATRFFFDGCDGEGFETGVDAYRGLWESLNGAGSWDVNPWVWVVEFKRIKP